jgi:hypothetical protein
MDANGACWTVPNAEVRMTYNWTLGRRPEERSPESPMRFPLSSRWRRGLKRDSLAGAQASAPSADDAPLGCRAC